jgi:hypothetical protein
MHQELSLAVVIRAVAVVIRAVAAVTKDTNKSVQCEVPREARPGLPFYIEPISPVTFLFLPSQNPALIGK